MSSTAFPYPPLSPALAVKNAAKAIEFYKEVFGAEERFRLVDPTSGLIGHAELSFQGYVMMISDEYPAFNRSPETLGGTPVKLALMVDNVDQVVEQARSAGATIQREPSNEFYGHRSAALRDPFGHEWSLQTVIEQVTPEEMQRRWNAMISG